MTCAGCQHVDDVLSVGIFIIMAACRKFGRKRFDDECAYNVPVVESPILECFARTMC